MGLSLIKNIVFVRFFLFFSTAETCEKVCQKTSRKNEGGFRNVPSINISLRTLQMSGATWYATRWYRTTVCPAVVHDGGTRALHKILKKEILLTVVPYHHGGTVPPRWYKNRYLTFLKIFFFFFSYCSTKKTRN